METRHLTPEFSVSGQITTDDVAVIHAMGFKSIICNRPDGEGGDQPLYDVIRRVAKKAELMTAYVPIRTPEPVEADLVAMSLALKTLPKPALSYSKTGTRSASAITAIIAQENLNAKA